LIEGGVAEHGEEDVRAADDGRDAGVKGQVSGVFAVFADDFGQDAGAGPDADAGIEVRAW
jgi:hypothetical protein